MKLFALILFVAANGITTAQSRPANPCDPAECPPVMCANPTYSEENCCGSCEDSACRFRGCVHFGAFGPTWKPDPCTECRCNNGEETCTQIDCDAPNCFGYPMRTRPGACCPECDFGLSDNACGRIPYKQMSLSVELENEQCVGLVTMHRCSKEFVWRNGRWHRCVPKVRGKPHGFARNCTVKRIIYNDVRSCQLREIGQDEIPADYDPSPHECSLNIPGPPLPELEA